MKMRFSRRKLAVAVLGSAAARAVAQEQPAPPRSPEDELKSARDRMKANIDTLSRQSIPMSTEPAFQFKP